METCRADGAAAVEETRHHRAHQRRVDFGRVIRSERPNGASGYSHGWSEAALGLAEPVDSVSSSPFLVAPEGRRIPDARHLLPTPAPCRLFDQGPRPWITPEGAERLYPYGSGIVRAELGVLYDIVGVEDHLHMYLRWRPDGLVSDLMRTVKSRSSKCVHETSPNLAAFAWQEGYSVFSVSKSQEEAVKKHIAGQAEHHKKEDFKSESLRILRVHGVEFDEQYVFD
ncbi:MAG: transposase [Phycisphaerales bacterium]